MTLRTAFLALCIAGLATSAHAADDVRYAAPESWVHAVSIPPVESVPDSGASQILLADDQTRFGMEADDFYSERAVRLRTPQALAGGNLIWSWKPDTETLTIHRVHIIREGKVIDLLAGGKKLTVLRRETGLEAAALDGALTATLQPEDLRVGDIMDFAVTLQRKDPLRRGYSEGFGMLGHSGVAGRVRMRAVWPAVKPVRWRATVGMPTATETKSSSETEVVLDVEKIEAPKKPAGAPGRFTQVGQIEFSQFKDWGEISAIMSPLYRSASALGPNSPLQAEISKIKAQHPDVKGRAFAALKLVEDQVRYVFLGMDLGGYLPADADLTWSRRFGDCKGKTVLLLALLHELGIEAEPVFVSTTAGDGLDQRLPLLSAFDHVIVHAQFAGQVYWLDGTRMGDRSIDDIPPPAFHWGLPVRPAGAQLLPIKQKSFSAPQLEKIVRLEVKDLSAPATVHTEQLFRGDAGIATHLVADALGKNDLDVNVRKFWADQYPWLKVTAVGNDYDPATGVMRLWADGAGTLSWNQAGDYRDYMVVDSALGGDPDFHREDGPYKEAPFAVVFPFYEKRTVTITLPGHGAGFTLWNPDGPVDAVVAAMAYRRTARLDDGVLKVETEARAVAPEFPAADSESAAAALRKLSFSNIFIRANAPSSPASASSSDKTDLRAVGAAEQEGGISARGAAALNSGKYDVAITEFTRAISLNPRSTNYVYDRGVAHFQKGDDDLAMADFNLSLRLDPTNSLALAARGVLELLQGKKDAAAKDFETALKLTPDRKALLLRRADAYHDSGDLPQAVEYYSEWLKAYPADAAVSTVEAQSCLARAELGRDVSAVLTACESLLKAKPRLTPARQGQALSLLRQFRYAEAVVVYDELVRETPDEPTALYGRGLARVGLGIRPQGQADLERAASSEAGVAQRFKRYGLAP